MSKKENMKTKDVILDEDIYPRKNKSDKTIESYEESLSIGASFPPILVQRVIDGDKETTIVLDGLHRLLAHSNRKIENIDVVHWKNKLLDKRENLTALRIASIKANLTHGVRLTNSDKMMSCRRMAEDDSKCDITQQKFADIFGSEQQTISDWISDIRARQKGSRDSLIYRLNFLGWSHQEIADVIGLKRPRITQIVNNTDFGKINADIDSGKSISEVAEFHGLDLPMTWAIYLNEKTDLEIFDVFGSEKFGNKQPKMSDYWKFSKGDLRLGLDYPGRLWAQDVMNILYRYSKQGDLIVDPMAGGGTSIDTCLIMSRKCRAYDIKPIRPDTTQNDITTGFPSRAKNCSLIIFDPPYHKKKEVEYDSENITKDRETFIEFVREFAINCCETLAENGVVAMVYGHWIDYDNELDSVFGHDLVKEFEDNGFRCVAKIQSPLTFNNQWEPPQIENAKTYDPWRMLPVSRDWYILRRLR